MPTLEMDEYEAANLLWLLRVASLTQLDTGDWCRQLRNRMEDMGDLGQANDDDPDSFAKDIRARRAADLTDGELTSLAWARACTVDQFEKLHQHEPASASRARWEVVYRDAVAALDRLLATRES